MVGLGVMIAGITALCIVVVFFYLTGGRGLIRIIFNYLIPDLPDKKYSWEDFRYRGEQQRISGFYSFGDNVGFSLWTLSGLKRFIHNPGTSVYSFRDTCAVVKQLSTEDANCSINPKRYMWWLSSNEGLPS